MTTELADFSSGITATEDGGGATTGAGFGFAPAATIDANEGFDGAEGVGNAEDCEEGGKILLTELAIESWEGVGVCL